MLVTQTRNVKVTDTETLPVARGKSLGYTMTHAIFETPRRCPRPKPHTTARLGRRATASAPSSPSGPDGPCASCWYGLKASRNAKSAAMREARLPIPLSERPICAGACPPADWSAPTPLLGVVGPRDKGLQDMVTTQGLQLAAEQYEYSKLGK